MTTEDQLRDRLRKIQALFEGATTIGATAATEPPVEFQFSIPDPWQRRLFSALCRRYGLRPFRYKRQRLTTIVVSAPRSFVNGTLWPEYQELRAALNSYLNEATERIIREEVYGDAAEASERAS
jgi:hypothetical protein